MTWLGIKVDDLAVNAHIKLKSHVKDFSWGVNYPVILTTDGVLLEPVDGEFKESMTDCVALFEQDKDLSYSLILTSNYDLHGLWVVGNELTVGSVIASNVKQATSVQIEENDYLAVYYINEQGQLWEDYPRRKHQDLVNGTVLGKLPTVKVTYTYERNELISGFCKDIQVTDKYFLILSRLTIYGFIVEMYFIRQHKQNPMRIMGMI